MMDWSDPHNPLFCPCNFLLSVSLHLMADVGPDTWLDSFRAAWIIKLCYMEVMHERKYGVGSEQARMVGDCRMAFCRMLRGPSCGPTG